MPSLAFPVFTYRSEMTDSAVRKEFEQLYASLRTVLHNLSVAVPQPPTDGGTEPPAPGDGMDLEYLGSYTAGTYFDGDIVIGSDGIAYVCVVDGTTTPPEPWPGGGIGGVISDAQYWVSTAHENLTAERDLGALASGYVKSTVSGGVSTPSTIAIIPLTEGGTGATTPPDARTNLGLGTMAVQNANNVTITGGTITAGSLTSTGNISAEAGQVSTVHVSATGNISAPNSTTTTAHLVASGNIAAANFYGDGSQITNLNAAQLTHGTVATARLGSGTASNETYLRGDQTWSPLEGIRFPAGLIALSVSPCPPGWTRVVWDGLFLRVGPTPGAQGGSASHTHGDHSHGPGTYQAAAHNHGGTVTIGVSGTTGAAGGHNHSVSLSGSGSGGTEASGNTYTLGYDSGGSTHADNQTNHTHNFSVNVNVSGNTSDVGDHSHSFSGAGGTSIPTNAPAVTGDSGLAGVPAASHIPPFIDIYLCQKN